MNIGFDFDGVIANSHPLKSIVARRMFGLDIPPEEFRRELIVSSGILTLAQYRSVSEEAMGGAYTIPPVADAVSYLRNLSRKHPVKIVTSRTGGMLQEAMSWLYAHEFSDLNVVGTGYGLPKTEACRGLDLYVDDDLEKLLPLIGIVPNLLFFSWPWNEYEQEPYGIVRISSWQEIDNTVIMNGGRR